LFRINEIFKFSLAITRDIPLTKAARLTTGPEVRGSRPILVAFLNFKDREEIFTKSKLLKSSNIYVSEDLSRKTREHRNELQKYMRRIKTKAPQKKCVIRYDKLYIDNVPYVYDDLEGRVIKFIPNQHRSDSSMSGRDSAMSGLLLPSGPIPGFPGKKPSLSRSESVHSVNGHPSEMGNFKRSPVFGSSENLDTTLHEDTAGESKALEEIVEEEKNKVAETT